MIDCGLISDIKKVSETKIFTEELKKVAQTVSKNDASVLISGEMGVGKSLFAKYIHFLSNGTENNFYSYQELSSWEKLVELIKNCNYLSEQKTIYFNRIEKLPLELQMKLVFLIKDTGINHRNVRFIFSTGVSLEEEIEQEKFSKDLYFLISTVLINMIPLRQRKEDIPCIADYFFNEYKKRYTSDSEGFSENAKSDMINYFWSGNISELKNAVERGIICATSSLINTQDMALRLVNDSEYAQNVVLENDNADKSLKTAIDSFKRAYLIKILEENNWNQTKTAKVLGIQRTYVIRLINELQIRKK